MNFVLSLRRFPDPIFSRPSMLNLTHNKWTFQFDKNDVGLEEHWFDENHFSKVIKLPFPWNSELSEIGTGDYVEIGWYATHFNVNTKSGVLLNFGAVNYSTMVWINGKYVGKHEGGYTPFRFDISNFVNNGTNTLIVRAFMPKNLQEIPHGKQEDDPPDPWSNVSFKRSCGIWQDVWLEFYDRSYIKSVKIYPSNNGKVDLNLNIFNEKVVKNISVKVINPLGSIVVNKSYESTDVISFDIKEPQFWDTNHPYLYFVDIKLMDPEKTLDEVYTYFGFRTIQTKNGLILINDKPTFLKMALAQGYWPKGVYTPPSTSDFKTDIELAKQLNFNGLEIHEKIENPRFLFWADVLGMYIWEEVPSFTNYDITSKERFEYTLFSMIKRDYNHPSIIIWTLFNENWGIWDLLNNKKEQNYISNIYAKVKNYDHSRLIIDNSGWDHVKTDITDVHLYEPSFNSWDNALSIISNVKAGTNVSFNTSNVSEALMANGYRYENEPIIVSEFDGSGFPENYIWEVGQLRMYKIAGFVYTELYDVEHEISGLYYYNRTPKFDDNVKEQIKLINSPDAIIFNIDPNHITYWANKSENIPIAFSHTSNIDLSNIDLSWSISTSDDLTPIKSGNFMLREVSYGLSNFFDINIKLPSGSYILKVKALDKFGNTITYNWLPMNILF
ncbi:MAG: beta galactosidase jelly roll domain-containing protein [Candidatus Parvarchaeota archaeon]|nr:beta galactosidase jelly roll domain-containing protein [Candidatus Jingweiarchaeum tengchongense]MCW1306127.1 beta galactosidase jelly roll domain-containing protein [Candidatus Jingweiarchaeum tengchongense]